MIAMWAVPTSPHSNEEKKIHYNEKRKKESNRKKSEPLKSLGKIWYKSNKSK